MWKVYAKATNVVYYWSHSFKPGWTPLQCCTVFTVRCAKRPLLPVRPVSLFNSLCSSSGCQWVWYLNVGEKKKRWVGGWVIETNSPTSERGTGCVYPFISGCNGPSLRQHCTCLNYWLVCIKAKLWSATWLGINCIYSFKCSALPPWHGALCVESSFNAALSYLTLMRRCCSSVEDSYPGLFRSYHRQNTGSLMHYGRNWLTGLLPYEETPLHLLVSLLLPKPNTQKAEAWNVYLFNK